MKKGYKTGKKNFKVHLDGYNFLPYLIGKAQKSPREDFFYFSDDDAWSQPGPNKPQKPDHTVPGQLSKEMLAGEWDISEVTAEMIKEFKKKYIMK